MKKGDLALLLISLEHLDAFREAYGFVASDDVLRAFSLMIVNTMRELNSGDDFLGHIGPADFVLTVAPSNLSALYERLRSRLDQSLDYFYPIKDREQASKRKDRLMVRMADLPLAARWTNLERRTIEGRVVAQKKIGIPLRITIVIPTYNEAENLPILVSALFTLPLDLRILVVDDNSPDGTGAIADNLAKRIRVCA